MLHYIQSSTKCRNLLIMEYFGEKNTKRCGKCDVCKTRNKLSMSEMEFDKIVKHLKPILQNKALSSAAIVEALPQIDEDEVLKVLRWLLDTEKISVENNLYQWGRGKLF